MGVEMTWDQFEAHLIAVGWTPEEAKKEREANEKGELGDCDGDLDAS